MAEGTKGRRRSPAAAPEDTPDPNAAIAESFGDAQRERVAALDPPDDDADLYERIAWILGNVPDVPKLGHAEVQMRTGGKYSYDYVREPEMMNAIRPLLGRAKVAAFPSVEDVVETGEAAKTVMTMTFVYREQRETIKVKVTGTDKGDRATVKALTTGMRYLLQKQFQISTDGIDPEKENIEPEPRQTPREAPKPARPRRASGKPTDAITPQARGTIYQHARSLFISDERVVPILTYASEGSIVSTDGIKTNEQLEWAFRQLERYASDPEAGEAKLAESGIAVADRTKLTDDDAPPPELTEEEQRLMNESDAQPPYSGGDDDISF